MTGKNLTTLETLCRDGASFEDALEQIGLADSPLSVFAMLSKHWQLLEMQCAYEAAKAYYDRLLEDRA